MHQRFFIKIENTDTGELREFALHSPDPEAALRTALRRQWVARWLLSEQHFRFVVSDRSTL